MIVEMSSVEYSDIRIPGIIATEKGSLLRYCECRRSVSDWADIDLKISRSDDGGESWVDVFWQKSGGDTLNNPVIIVNGDKLIFLFCRNYMEIWKCVSQDDGLSFSEPERVHFNGEGDFFYNVVAVGPGHGIVKDGRLLIPIWFAANKDNPKAHYPSFISTLFSDDGGESWSLGEIIFQEKLRNPSECALALTKEDNVLISIRHEGKEKMRALAESSNGATDWRDLRFEENLTDPICMGSMTHRGGLIYHTNCAHTDARENLTVKISDDRFKSCREIFVSQKGGYSDIALLVDKICIFYEKINEQGACELYFEKIAL